MFGILLIVKRQSGLKSLLFAMLVHPFNVALLDARAIRQHDLAEVPGGVGRVDISRKSLSG